MKLDLHADIRVEKLTIGRERAPLIVIDNFVANPQALVDHASDQTFSVRSRYYPGIRARAPLSYETLLLTRFEDLLLECLEASSGALRFSMCEYSLVTTRPEQLAPPQRIPHIDSLSHFGLATIHYLFHKDLGGTAFYRHRGTSFEYVDEMRNQLYVNALNAEFTRPDAFGPGYINGDTPQFEQIAKQDARFNRLLIYRRNSLHSGCIDRHFVPDESPASGRLSINSFIDVTPS